MTHSKESETGSIGVGEVKVSVCNRFDETELLDDSKLEQHEPLNKKITLLQDAGTHIWGRVGYDSKGKVVVLSVIAGSLATAGVVGIGTYIKHRSVKK